MVIRISSYEDTLDLAKLVRRINVVTLVVYGMVATKMEALIRNATAIGNRNAVMVGNKGILFAEQSFGNAEGKIDADGTFVARKRITVV